MSDEQIRLMATAPSERYQSLDILRGFSVLGILVMNIQSFSMIGAAYLNPTAYGDLTGMNLLVWLFSHVFGDMKFMTIFSILFGAGVVLISARVESKGGKPGWLHYRRVFWLLVIGLFHAYVLWYGDILVSYALCAIGIYLFRKRSSITLLVVGFFLLCIPSVIWILFGLSLPYWPQESIAELMVSWRPEPEVYFAEIDALRGGFAEQLSIRIPASLYFQTILFLSWTGWRVAGLMLIGMALFKWGVLTTERSPRFYVRMVLIGFLVGLPLIMTGVYLNFSAFWSLKYSMFLGVQFNYWGSLFVSAAFIGVIMLWSKSDLFEKLKDALAAAGRMAFTNYLLQTVICTFIFYGHGLGQFGKVERWGQLLIVIGIWILILVISPLWLRRFRFGPVEWLWRTLTYFKFQSMQNRT